MEEVSQYSIKYRPTTFEDIYGQKEIIKSIQKRIKDNNYPQAILLQGQYGVGKTSVGLITAAAMNCHFEDGNPDWSNPDNKSILNQTFDRDTLLFDASRWSGKDAMVEFTSIMKTRPLYSTSGLRIFIIEEIDQASSAAKLALLKILEKPDPFNKFILLSMEPNGVPQSIKSRCQVYNFKPISIRDTMYALKSIMEKTGDWNNENIPNEFRTEGLVAIASNSKGSLRVAIQNLEACIEGEIYTKEGIEDLIGVVDEASTMTILRGLLDKTSDKIIWSNIYKVDPQELYNYLTLILSNVMIYRMTGYIDDDRFEDSTKVMANHENLYRLFDILTTHPQLCKPYMRKCDLLSALAEYYKNTIGSREKGERLMESITPSVPVRRIIKNGT